MKADFLVEHGLRVLETRHLQAAHDVFKPIVGGVALAAGIALLLVGRRAASS